MFKISWNPKRGTINILAVISFLIFLASLIVHILTFLPNPMVTMEATIIIHVAIFIPFGAMMFILATTTLNKKGDTKKGLRDQYMEGIDKSFKAIGRILRIIPVPVLILAIGMAVYIPINFFIMIGNLSEGSPVEDGGKYYLDDHGVVVRELTKEEYMQYQAYEVRGFSGHWMAFSFIPFVYYVFIDKKVRTGRQGPNDNNYCNSCGAVLKMGQSTGEKKDRWFWVGIFLLSISALFWLFFIIGFALDPEDMGVAILGAILITAIPIGIGFYLVRRFKKPVCK